MKLHKFLLTAALCLLFCRISFGANNTLPESQAEQFTLSAAVLEVNLFSLYENENKKRLSEIGVLELTSEIFLRPEIAQISGKASIVVAIISDGNQVELTRASVLQTEKEQVRFTKDIYEDEKSRRVTEFTWAESTVDFTGRISHILGNNERICFNFNYKQVIDRIGAFNDARDDGTMPNTERNWNCNVIIKPDGKPVIAGSSEQKDTAAFLLVWANKKTD